MTDKPAGEAMVTDAMVKAAQEAYLPECEYGLDDEDMRAAIVAALSAQAGNSRDEVPDIVHHTDGEEGLDIGYHVEFPDGRYIWCGELTNRRCDELDEETKATLGITNGGGFFLEVNLGNGLQTIGRAAGADEAKMIVEAFSCALASRGRE